MTVKRTHLFLWVLLFQGIAVVAASRLFLPEKYFLDSELIRRYFDQGFQFVLFDSYLNTALFYKLFGIHLVPSILFEGLFTYFILCFCMFRIWKTQNTPITFRLFFFLFVWNVPAAIYLGQLSKEIIAVLVITLQTFVMGRGKKRWEFLALLSILFYAMFFRTYWFIILYLYVILFFAFEGRVLIRRFLVQLRKHSKVILPLAGIILMFIAAGFNQMYLTDTRTDVNVNRGEDVDATTIIHNPFINRSVITDVINWLYTWFNLLLPLKLFAEAGLQHIVFALWNVFTIVLLVVVIRGFFKYGETDKHFYWMTAFIIAFSCVQAIFEPDFGSFLKHEIALLPIVFSLLLRYEKMRFIRLAIRV